MAHTAMALARSQGRIGRFPYDPRYPVQTFWDIGHSDTTAIVCHQQIGAFDRMIWAYEQSGEDMQHFVRQLQNTGFQFGAHYFPHDAKNTTLAAKSNPLGKNVWDQAFTLGLRDLKLVPRTKDVWTAINATRLRLDTVQYDDEGCTGLIAALESYHKKWDESRKCYSNDPVHDWSSNYADAMRQWAQGYTGQGLGKSFTAPDPQNFTAKGRFTAPFTAPTNMRTIGQRRVGY